MGKSVVMGIRKVCGSEQWMQERVRREGREFQREKTHNGIWVNSHTWNDNQFLHWPKRWGQLDL